jgi:hypothetical protein
MSNLEINPRVIATYLKRGKTNNGDLCKQRIILYGSCNEDVSLLIYKYVLCTDFELYKKDFIHLKSIKEKHLYRQTFSIRVSTLKDIVTWLNNLSEQAINNAEK